jgi:hypothetical protein
MPEVYKYDDLPRPLRVQMTYILRDVFGDGESHYHEDVQRWFATIRDAVCREHGELYLGKDRSSDDPRRAVLNFILVEPNVERVLDIIEVSLVFAEAAHEHGAILDARPRMNALAAIEEANSRFQEHGIGFRFESPQLIRIDSELVHEEVVRPALRVLVDPRFKGANHEFLRAHEHYRHGRAAEAINECLKSLESVLKVICAKRKWPYKETDAAKALLDIVFAQGLVPSYQQSGFAGLRSLLESGVPTTRSRTSAHGTGAAPKKIPLHLAAFVLHQTASSILFLVEAEKALP